MSSTTTNDATLQSYTSSPFTDFFSKNTRGLWMLVLVVIVIAGAVILVNGKRDQKAGAARTALFTAHKSLQDSLKAIAAADAPAAAAPAPAKAGEKPKAPAAPDAETVAYKQIDVDAKLGDSVVKFKDVIANFPGTLSAHEAQLELANLYLNHGDAAKALPYFQQAVESSPNGLEKVLTTSGQGYALEAAGKNKEAIDSFQKAISLVGTGDAGAKGDLLLSVARNYEKLNDSAQARSTYDQVISQLPNTEYSRSAESYKAQLGN